MNIKYIRSLVENRPFHPLTIHLSDGRSLDVLTAEHLFLPPMGELFIVVEKDGSFHHVGVDQMTGVKLRASS